MKFIIPNKYISNLPLRSKSKQKRPSSVPMTRRSGSIIAPDITFLMNAKVLSNSSLALKIYSKREKYTLIFYI